MGPQRQPSSDGVEVAVHDLGGRPDGQPMLLVHATGFCAAVFRPLAAALGQRFRCWAVDLRGHGETLTPPTVDYAWSGFADDVLAALAVTEAAGARPVAMGHSSGGAAVLAAEAERPGTFAALWCYEPIVWPDPAVAQERAERLAAGARKRRAYANFSAKPPFSALAPEALRAYVEGGFAAGPDGAVSLRCRPEAEAAVYLRAVEGDRYRRLAEVGCPVVVAASGRSDAITPGRAQALVDALPAGRHRRRVLQRAEVAEAVEDAEAAVLADLP
jgi:pimeloyl-ACP methyl ester carboxylesterase